ncbi:MULTISPECIES: transposase [unclassified Mesorhizobium]|uniref:transposase n=1 Tax=unclassified Mesorhizobium TaxID=325217 RepID=UPI003337348A
MPDDRSFHVLEAVANRLEASPQRPRRRWSAEAKSRLIEATLKPGANVSAIARQAGMAPAQLFGWRSKAIKSGAVTPHRMRSGSALSRSRRQRLRRWRSSWVAWSFAPVPISMRSSWCGLSGRFARHDPGWREGVARQSSRRF